MVSKAKDLLHRTLVFFRIVDPFDKNVSITNIALILTLYKLAVTESTSLVDVGAVMVSLSNYSIKKFINKDNINTAAKIATQIAEKTESISPEEKE